jgi:hypothetical protein
MSNPGNALPREIDMRLANTENEIMPGIEAGLNQLLARIEGELRMKIFPIAAKIEPAIHQPIYPY